MTMVDPSSCRDNLKLMGVDDVMIHMKRRCGSYGVQPSTERRVELEVSARSDSLIGSVLGLKHGMQSFLAGMANPPFQPFSTAHGCLVWREW